MFLEEFFSFVLYMILKKSFDTQRLLCKQEIVIDIAVYPSIN